MSMKLNKYTHSLFCVLLLGFSVGTTSSQSIEDLESKHGFQDIILDSDISNYTDLTYQKKIKIEGSEDPILLYERANGAYKNIADVSIKDLEVKTFLGKIIEIIIITEKKTEIMQGLKILYGEPNFSIRSNAWEWRSESVVLSVRSINKNRIEIRYISRKLNQYIKENKEREIKEVSSDFEP